MTDAEGPGTHVLYQDFVVPTVPGGAAIGFALFIGNGQGAGNFFAPASLDFSTPAINQQARVDIVRTSADPFSVATADVLQNLYQTKPGDPLTAGYNNLFVDVTALFQAQQGQTLRLRFAEVDNLAPFNFGVDNVSISLTASAIPEPSSWTLAIGALAGLGLLRRRKS
jgi:MYXO-CTERM domain-containing protein